MIAVNKTKFTRISAINADFDDDMDANTHKLQSEERRKEADSRSELDVI
jgi:hypothetical protein